MSVIRVYDLKFPEISGSVGLGGGYSRSVYEKVPCVAGTLTQVEQTRPGVLHFIDCGIMEGQNCKWLQTSQKDHST